MTILAVAVDLMPTGRPITQARFTRDGVLLSLSTHYPRGTTIGSVCSRCGVTYYMPTGCSTCGLCTDWHQPHPVKP